MIVDKFQTDIYSELETYLLANDIATIRGFMDKDIVVLICTSRGSICMVNMMSSDVESFGIDNIKINLQKLFAGFIANGSVRIIDLKLLDGLDGYTYMEYLQESPDRQTLISCDKGKRKLIIWGGELHAKD